MTLSVASSSKAVSNFIGGKKLLDDHYFMGSFFSTYLSYKDIAIVECTSRIFRNLIMKDLIFFYPEAILENRKIPFIRAEVIKNDPTVKLYIQRFEEYEDELRILKLEASRLFLQKLDKNRHFFLKPVLSIFKIFVNTYPSDDVSFAIKTKTLRCRNVRFTYNKHLKSISPKYFHYTDCTEVFLKAVFKGRKNFEKLPKISPFRINQNNMGFDLVRNLIPLLDNALVDLPFGVYRSVVNEYIMFVVRYDYACYELYINLDNRKFDQAGCVGKIDDGWMSLSRIVFEDPISIPFTYLISCDSNGDMMFNHKTQLYARLVKLLETGKAEPIGAYGKISIPPLPNLISTAVDVMDLINPRPT